MGDSLVWSNVHLINPPSSAKKKLTDTSLNIFMGPSWLSYSLFREMIQNGAGVIEASGTAVSLK